MDALLSLFTSTIQTVPAQMLALFLIFLPLFFFAYWALKRGLSLTLRPIAAYETMKGILAQGAEAGQPVHLSVGIAGVGDRSTADTMAGLYVLEYIADRAAVSANPPIVTVAHPTALPVAQDLLRRAYARNGDVEEYDPTRTRLIAPDPNLYTGHTPNPAIYPSHTNDALAYAAGTMRLLTPQRVIANVMVGLYGDEFLLLAEPGAQRQLNQIGGTSAVGVLPFVYTSVAHPLFGEEIYAAGAYLSNRLAHLSSLLAQDVMRWFIVAAILIGILAKSFGLG